MPLLPDQQRLAWEKEALGFFLSHHPFEDAARRLASRISTNTSQITEESKGERITLAGAIMSVRKVVTRKQETVPQPYGLRRLSSIKPSCPALLTSLFR